MSDLTDFLLARIAEDEAAARECIADYEHEHERRPRDAELWDTVEATTWGIGDFVHLVAYPPQRVLADCEAKRLIVELHPNASQTPGIAYCNTCNDGDEAVSWPCGTLLALASVRADHPEFRPEWRIED